MVQMNFEYIVSEEMKKVRDIQVEMVTFLLKVCQKHNLKIWADGGTLLGTVRHKGYIPWDDDIDLLMFREDYDKLISLADKEFHSPFFLQSAYTDKRYYRGHAQMRCDNTAAIRPDDIFSSFHQGIFIDIFVYDFVPDIPDETWLKKLKAADDMQRKLLIYMRNFPISLHPSQIIDYWKLKIYFSIFSPLRIYRRFENLFKDQQGNSCEHISCPTFLREHFDRTTKDIEWYQSTIWLPFENISLPVPSGYDYVLRTQYGDSYMIPRKAPSYHGELIFSTEKSYKEILPGLRCQKIKELYKKFLKKFGVNG